MCTDWDRADETAERLINEKKYPPEQAVAYLRKLKIRELFEKNERVQAR